MHALILPAGRARGGLNFSYTEFLPPQNTRRERRKLFIQFFFLYSMTFNDFFESFNENKRKDIYCFKKNLLEEERQMPNRGVVSRVCRLPARIPSGVSHKMAVIFNPVMAGNKGAFQRCCSRRTTVLGKFSSVLHVYIVYVQTYTSSLDSIHSLSRLSRYSESIQSQ